MSVVLGTPGGPEGQFANDHWEAGTSSPAGMSGPLGRGESLGRTRSSAWAAVLSVDTAGKLLNAVLPLSGSVNGVAPPKLRSQYSVRMRSVIGFPRSIATGKLTVSRLAPGALSAPQPTQAITYPCRSSQPLPKSAAVVGLLLFAVAGVLFSMVCEILLPRLLTSKNRRPLAFAPSTGRRMSMSKTTALCGLRGSASKKTVPVSFSYGPRSPNG